MYTISEVSSLWYSSLPETCPATQRQLYRTVLDNYIIRFIGHLELNQLTDHIFQEYYVQVFFSQSFRERRHQLIASYHRDILSAVCSFAVEQHMIDSLSPPLPSRIQKASELSYHPPNPDDIHFLLSQERNNPVELVILLAWHAGLIRNEIAALRFDHLDLVHQMIHIGNRQIPISNPLMTAIKDVLNNPQNKSQYVVTSSRGKAFSNVSISTLLANTLKKYHLSDITLSDLRHHHILQQLETIPVEQLPQLAHQLGYNSSFSLVRKYMPYIRNLSAVFPSYDLSKGSCVVSHSSLARSVSRLSGLSLSTCTTALSSLVEIMTEVLSSGGQVELSPIGTIFVFEEVERKVYDFQKKLTVTLPPQQQVGFKPARELFKQLNHLPDDYSSRLYAQFYDNDVFYHYNGKHVFRNMF